MTSNSDAQNAVLASLAATLQGSSLESFVSSMINQATEKLEKPSNPGQLQSTPTDAKSKEQEAAAALQQHDKKDTTSVALYVAPTMRNYIQRDISTSKSYYVPNMYKMFYIINEMDSVMSDNFYARRALPFSYPTISRIYISIALTYHLLHVGDSAGILDPGAQAFYNDFKSVYPLDMFPIPGPVVPIFKSLCISVPENKRYRQVLPTFPADFLDIDSTATRFSETAATSQRHFLIPSIPMLIGFHNQLFSQNTVPTFGANDSGPNPGSKTLTMVASTDYPLIVDLLHHPSQTTRRAEFPFIKRAGSNSVPNATNDANPSTQFVLLNNVHQDVVSGANDDFKNSFLKVGLAEPIRVNKDLTTQFKNNRHRIALPEVDLTTQLDNWAEMFCVQDGMEWIGELAASYGAYCAYWPGSATLQDIGAFGPNVGQFICQPHMQGAFPAAPNYFGDVRRIHQFNVALTTSTSEDSLLSEGLAYYGQTHVRYPAAHTLLHVAGANRNGPFWDVRPIYGPGTVDHSWMQLPQLLKSAAYDKVPHSKN